MVLVAAVTKCIDHSTFLHCVLLSVICFVEQIISCQSMNAEAVDVLKPMIMPIWFVKCILFTTVRMLVVLVRDLKMCNISYSF